MIANLVTLALICLCLVVWKIAAFKMPEDPWYFLGCLASIALVLWLAYGNGLFVRPWNKA